MAYRPSRLAESWTVSADAATYTFKLRKDAVFGSGNPVTFEDVRFSLLRAKNIKGYGSFLADPLKTVEIVDPQTVRVILNGPDATFLAALAAGVFSILDSKTVRAQGGVETAGADALDKAEQWFYTHSAGRIPGASTSSMPRRSEARPAPSRPAGLLAVADIEGVNERGTLVAIDRGVFKA